jgi:hypothetical protein
MRILTGEKPEDYGEAPAKNEAAAELGRAGGKKRAESPTAEQRAEIAKKAAAKRWRVKEGLAVVSEEVASDLSCGTYGPARLGSRSL